MRQAVRWTIVAAALAALAACTTEFDRDLLEPTDGAGSDDSGGLCGNSRVDPGEECDLPAGEGHECTTACDTPGWQPCGDPEGGVDPCHWAACLGTDEELCGNGEDDDCDGSTDAADPDCGGVEGGVLDLLVVLDADTDMSEYLDILPEMLPEFSYNLVDPAIHPELPVVEDLNLLVVTTDLGTGGFDFGAEGCINPEHGFDGCGLTRCDAPIHSFENGGDPLDGNVVRDALLCLTGERDGCFWQQPLGAVRRAIEQSAGGCNDGFLRPGEMLAVLLVTNDDDWTVKTEVANMMFDPSAPLGPPRLRAFSHSENLVNLDEFISLAESYPGGLVVGMMVGVPDAGPCVGDGTEVGACLAEEEMVQEPGPADRLKTSCLAVGPAYPPVRLVQFAESLGEDALVGSLCADVVDAWDDFGIRFAEMIRERL